MCGGGGGMCFSFGVVCVVVVMGSMWCWSGWVVKELVGDIWVCYRWCVGFQVGVVWWVSVVGVSVWCLGLVCVLRFVVCGGGGGGVVRVCGDGVVVVGMVGWFGVGGVVCVGVVCFDVGGVGSVCVVFGDLWVSCGVGGCGVFFGGEVCGLVVVVCFVVGVVWRVWFVWCWFLVWCDVCGGCFRLVWVVGLCGVGGLGWCVVSLWGVGCGGLVVVVVWCMCGGGVVVWLCV